MSKVTIKKQNGWRGSEELWLDAAYELLVTAGVEAVKVMALAKVLSLSRTSFYWHFDDREALLAALVQRWEEKNTGNLVSQSQLYAESITEAMFNLFDCWLNAGLFDAQLDFAIRNWAQNSPQLKVRLEKTDLLRIEAIKKMFKRFGFSDQQADIRAHTVYYTQIGYISMMVDEPTTSRLERMPAYVATYTGTSPQTSEISRFKARHQVRIKH
ncbi:MAG: TetR/AcrR family transcriptional regulator [Proteobacteria bacterium]|nr:TetR/AcrR family transcriptional regulator [Pseudomonadota bacterium]